MAVRNVLKWGGQPIMRINWSTCSGYFGDELFQNPRNQIYETCAWGYLGVIMRIVDPYKKVDTSLLLEFK